ncbi:ClpX C4-type zinc finger protein [Mycobacterium marinum]|uniref:ClpX C4-type zinc finger protein n=1 Tax=Mycobacterium marinum TaxID=1781 RepID=UPI00234233A1|nr:ClpX C4-type zinc finger protein [Mycobacterium marinum]MDC8994744.1 ClpX C4-type zinc finger protein [Mycobacterium marinum]WDZ16653.1 ClpX C4-type zinc finger protein [Mycobacterium marinum]
MLVAGAGVQICNECVATAAAIMDTYRDRPHEVRLPMWESMDDQQMLKLVKPLASPGSPRGSDSRCSGSNTVGGPAGALGCGSVRHPRYPPPRSPSTKRIARSVVVRTCLRVRWLSVAGRCPSPTLRGSQCSSRPDGNLVATMKRVGKKRFSRSSW